MELPDQLVREIGQRLDMFRNAMSGGMIKIDTSLFSDKEHEELIEVAVDTEVINHKLYAYRYSTNDADLQIELDGIEESRVRTLEERLRRFRRKIARRANETM